MRPESGENPVEEKQDPLSGKEGSNKDSGGDGDEASSSSSGAKNKTEGGHGVEVEEHCTIYTDSL